jgi:hypothetical protein
MPSPRPSHAALATVDEDADPVRAAPAEDHAATAPRQTTLFDVAHSSPTGPTSIPTRSPWGQVQSHTVMAPGIVSVTTAGHGGIHLDPWRVRQMPRTLGKQAWYEEDCEWSKPIVAFAAEFDQKTVESAKATLRGWFPHAYEAHFQEVIPPGMSGVKDRETYAQQHENDYLAVAAWGAGKGFRRGVDLIIPDGKVLVEACLGRHHHDHPSYNGLDALTLSAGGHESAYFLVDRPQYDSRSAQPLVMDPTIATRVKLSDFIVPVGG